MPALAVELIARDRTLGARLDADLQHATRVSIAVAYAKESALRAVDLESWAGPGHELRLLAGTDFALTELGLLERLQSRASATCRIFHGMGSVNFHPKLYVIDKPDSRVAYVGSSNLTFGGLRANVEANLRVEAPLSTPEADAPLALFDGLFFGEFATPVSEEFAQRYLELQQARREAEREPSRVESTERLHAAEALLLGRYRADAANTRRLLVVTPENYALCMRTRTWGHQQEQEIATYQPGDVFFFHVTGGRGIAAMGMFTGAPYHDEAELWRNMGKGSFPWRIRFVPLGELRTGIPTKAILEPLRPGAPKNWFNGFIQSSHTLQPQDFAALQVAFEAALRLERGL